MPEMNGGDYRERRRGSVKTAVNSYGETIPQGNFSLKKPQAYDSLQNPSARNRELHEARRDIGLLDESRKVAESTKAQAESELQEAKKTVKDLTLKIEESNSRVKARIGDLEKRSNGKRGGDWGMGAPRNGEKYQYVKVMREIDYLKQELSKLKLDMASLMEEKRRAEERTAASTSKLESYSSKAEELAKEIEEISEEHVLVELARIEAAKELEAIEAQRREDAKQHLAAMESTKKRMNDIKKEIESSKGLETELAVATSDIKVLESELKQVKEMEQNLQSNQSSKHLEPNFDDESHQLALAELSPLLQELEAAKKELAAVKEESFQFMASMDVIRNELKHVGKETAKVKKKEEKADLTIQSLNSKLLRAKAKLEAASASEEKAKSIVSNLMITLEQLKAETQAAKDERDFITEETSKIKAEIQKTESQTDSAEERLQVALEELENVKSSEALALENLKMLTENAMKNRASDSRYNSKITISAFEYEYLTGRANRAEEIADKKVAAAQAWNEALKASEKEILMKAKMAQLEIMGLRLEEEQEVFRTERSLSAKKIVEQELLNSAEKYEKLQEQGEGGLPRRSANRSGKMTPTRRLKFQRSASSAGRRTPRLTPLSVRRKRKVIPGLAKFFSGKNEDEDQ